MRSLGTIEPVGVLISPLRGSIRRRIWAFRDLAIIARVDAVVTVEEEGRGRGENHPSCRFISDESQS